jgi:hypothetical protein
MLPLRVLYYGRDEPLPEQVPLRAGPLSLVYENGDLRQIRFGGDDVVRRIYMAVRDRNWNTISPALSNLRITQGDATFAIEYDVANREGEIDFAWRGAISGTADGTITLSMDGVARSTFWRNRIGFCLLIPAECAGARATVTHADGSVEEGAFPTYIAPTQPVPPFAALGTVRYELRPGVWAEVSFSGDVFEMEDQRNWTDASYKIFSTPIHLPFPVEIRAGTRITQSITIRLVPEPATPSLEPAVPRDATVTINMPAADAAVPLPTIGLDSASHDGPLSEAELARLAALHLGHLRVDLRLAETGYPARLQRAAGEAQRLGLPLEAALIVSDNAEAEVAALLPVLEAVKPVVGRWLVYPQRELFWGGSPVAQAVAAARRYLGAYQPGIPLAAGTDTDFIFVQRSRPPLDLIDLFTVAMNPQVHAFDNASLVETLPTQAAVVASARRLAGAHPVIVSTVTLKQRFNAAATGPTPPTPAGELPPQVDPRQMSLFGAGWTVGSIKYLALAGAQSVTYYETTGWRGVMETATGSPLPQKLPSLAGSVFPLYHVLADVGELAGGAVLPVHASDPRAVEVLALRRGPQTRLLVANLTAQAQAVRLYGWGPQARVRRLDDTTAIEAMQSPEAFRRRQMEPLAVREGRLDLVLHPYAVVCVDAEVLHVAGE